MNPVTKYVLTDKYTSRYVNTTQKYMDIDINFIIFVPYDFWVCIIMYRIKKKADVSSFHFGRKVPRELFLSHSIVRT